MKKILVLFSILFISFSAMNAQDVNVTFQVDMRGQALSGNFDPATDVVTVPGGFNNWLNEPPANDTKTMDDADGDSIYTKTIAMAPNATYEYKYNIGLGWDGKDENTGNRSVDVGGVDLVVPVVFFQNQSIGGMATVTFNVDMELIAATDFDPATDNVYIAGSFTDWQNSAVMMSDPESDSIYTVEISQTNTGSDLMGGSTLAFKFIYGDTTGQSSGSGDVSWESVSDRNFFIFDGANEFTAYWDDVEPGVETGDGDIDFTVDLSVMETVGLYDPDHDSLFIRGGFNGWGETNPMLQDIFVPTDWFVEIPFVDEPINAEQNYKFFIKTDSAANPNVGLLFVDGYERPISQGGGNRDVNFLGVADQDAGRVYFDDIHPDWVLPAGEAAISITFQVDMTDAVAFDPATDEVWWISEQPAFAFTQGWTDSDTMRVLQMLRVGTTNIFEGTLTVNGPSWNGFEYRYGYVHEGAWQQELGGFDDFSYRTRFCEMTAPNAFVQPYTAPVDRWDDYGEADAELSPPGLVRVSDLDLTVSKFELAQNFPNPFNPTTNIRFSIPEAGLVTLKVFNLLGQEVQTIINREMNSGSYQTDFNASKLSSGIYFYTIKVNDFTATKKMMLLK
jgi:hypothetical protein